jgi:hypothetical protein
VPSKGKAKGNGWEREVADFLSEMYGESFVRVPNSGAFIGGKNSHRKSNLSEQQIRGFKGDIIPGPSFPNLNLEAKFYKDFAFHQVLQGSCKQLDEWINQMLTTCDELDINILAMKFNRKGSFIAHETKHLSILNTGSNHIRYHNSKLNHGPWIIQEFNNFWQLNSTHIKKLTSTSTQI